MPGSSQESPATIPTRTVFLEVSGPIAQTCYSTLHHRLGYSTPHLWQQQAQEFWPTLLSHSLPLVICEGAKKAGCLLSHGYPAVALPGVWNGRRTVKSAGGRTMWDYLIPELALFATPGRSILFAFDQDEKGSTQRDVRSAMQATARLFEAAQCVCYSLEWELGWGKGIDDVAGRMGAELVHEIMGDWIEVYD